jgi:hypothetical protein
MEVTNQRIYYLAIYIADFFTSSNRIDIRQYQMIGCCALNLSELYEGVTSQDPDYYVYISNNSFTEKQFIEMREKIWIALDFNLYRTLPYDFLRFYLNYDNSIFNSYEPTLYQVILSQQFCTPTSPISLASYSELAQAIILAVNRKYNYPPIKRCYILTSQVQELADLIYSLFLIDK